MEYKTIYELNDAYTSLFKSYKIEDDAIIERLLDLQEYWHEHFTGFEQDKFDIYHLISVLLSNDSISINGKHTGKLKVESQLLLPYLISESLEQLPHNEYKAIVDIDSCEIIDKQRAIIAIEKEKEKQQKLRLLLHFVNPRENKWKPMMGLLFQEVQKVIISQSWATKTEQFCFVFDILAIRYPHLLDVDKSDTDKFRYVTSSIESYQKLPNEVKNNILEVFFLSDVSPEFQSHYLTTKLYTNNT